MNELALNFKQNLLDALKTWQPGSVLPELLKDAGASENWQLLTTHLGGLTRHDTAEVVVKLLDPTAEGKMTQFGWDWTAKASAQAELSIDVLSEKQLGDMKMQPADKHQIVGYSASFDVNASGGGTQKIGAWGSASANGELAGGARLTWYVEAPDTVLLLQAAIDAAKFARLPNDLEGMLRLAGNGVFWGAAMTLNGSLQVGVSAKAEATSTGWTYGFGGDKVGLGLAVHAGVSLKLALSGGMTLRVVPERGSDGKWGLRVDLESARESNKSFAASVGAALDLSALAKSAESAVRAGLPELNAKALDALTLPGTAIKEKLTALLAANITAASWKQIASLLLGTAEPADVKQALLARLTEPLSDLLDKQLDALALGNNIAAEKVDAWFADVLGTSTVADDLKKKLKGLIDQAATLASTELTDSIDGLTKDLQQAAGGPLDQILNPLGALGEKIGKALDGLDENKFSKAIKDTLAAYSQRRIALLKALGDASKAKLGIEIAFSIETSRKSKLAFSAWFGSDGDQRAAQRLYQAVCTGRLQLLGELIDAAVDGKAVRDVSGWLMASLKQVGKSTLTVNVFGLNLSSSSTRLIDLEIKTDAWGNVMAATTLASAEAAIANPWVQRTTSLAVAATIVDDQATSAKSLQIALNGAYTAQGKRTDRRWVQSLVDGYARDMGRSSGANVGDILRAPDDDADGAKGFWRAVSVAMPIRLDADAWVRFQGRSELEIRRAFLRHGLSCLDNVYAGKRGFEHTSPKAELLDYAELPSGPKISDPNDRILAYLSLYRPVLLKTAGTEYWESVGFPNLSPTGFSSPTQSAPGHVKIGVFHRFAALLRSAEALKSCAGDLRTALLPGQAMSPAVLRNRAEGPLRRMTEALSQAAVASETFLGLGFLGAQDEGLPWVLSTFALAITELAGEEPPLPFANRTVDGVETVVPLLAFL